MISLSSKSKVPPLQVVTLPSCCTPSGESNDLVAKREAQLKWMREKGLNYLGDPQRPIRHKPQLQRRATASPVRLVSTRPPEPRADATDAAREA